MAARRLRDEVGDDPPVVATRARPIGVEMRAAFAASRRWRGRTISRGDDACRRLPRSFDLSFESQWREFG